MAAGSSSSAQHSDSDSMLLNEKILLMISVIDSQSTSKVLRFSRYGSQSGRVIRFSHLYDNSSIFSIASMDSGNSLILLSVIQRTLAFFNEEAGKTLSQLHDEISNRSMSMRSPPSIFIPFKSVPSTLNTCKEFKLLIESGRLCSLSNFLRYISLSMVSCPIEVGILVIAKSSSSSIFNDSKFPNRSGRFKSCEEFEVKLNDKWHPATSQHSEIEETSGTLILPNFQWIHELRLRMHSRRIPTFPGAAYWRNPASLLLNDKKS
ncbi:hypothetical protein EJ110_NYTH11596 [Nymphaea thermarum]|nr:hypothetical protein EJ110_NYTH11596 [Nymphaea thermarum]